MAFQLFLHNQKAYETVEDFLESYGKAAVIHPTGTGKSFIAFRLVVEHPDKRILWLAPSAYIFRTQIENVNCFSKFANGFPTNVTFLTYTKLTQFSEQEIRGLKPDYIVLDEFHRCGAALWGRYVQMLLAAFKKAKVLGLSATNIRYLDNQRDMADELFDGHIASAMTLGEAMVRKILPTPKYVISVYSYKEEIGKLEERIASIENEEARGENETLLEQLKRALEYAKGLPDIFSEHMKKKDGKYIVFCANRSHMNQMSALATEWFAKVDEQPHIYQVWYDNPETDSAFSDFKKDQSGHLKLLYCIDMLNEGVHINDIDGVILLRPTVSPILYLQQIGRSLSAGVSDEPVIFDIVNNFENLYSIDTIQNEVQEAFRIMECDAEEQKKFSDAFRIVDMTMDCRKLLETLKQNLQASWERYYLAAKEYYAKNGSLKIPKAYVTDKGLSLGVWIVTQRRVYAGKAPGNLSKEQIAALSAIGMEWENKSAKSFAGGLEALTQYVLLYGTADVKADYVSEERFPLGKWVSNLRHKYRMAQSGIAVGGGLTGEQIAALSAVGMIWDKADYQWEQNYKHAKVYYEQNGNLNIAYGYVTKEGVKLGAWLANQRQNYAGNRKGAAALKKEQIDKLSAIGMDWEDQFTKRWQIHLKLAQEFYKENGHLDIPVNYCIDGVELGRWIASVRRKREKPSSSGRKLNAARIEQLDQIEMIWEKKATAAKL